ncbi:hypothetical protein [Lactococcus lactis]|nr:hypothetical protein [Lactococcus lactis]
MKIDYKPKDLMKKQKLDFMKYQYEEIGARIKNKGFHKVWDKMILVKL